MTEEERKEMKLIERIESNTRVTEGRRRSKEIEEGRRQSIREKGEDR
jgi:hypothetical protein